MTARSTASASTAELAPGVFSLPDYDALRIDTRTLTGVAAYAEWPLVVNGDHPRQVLGVLVSDDYFDVLGVPMQAGRGLRAADGAGPRPGEGDAREGVVVSDAYWRSALGGRRDVLGRSLRLNGWPFTIAGVAPPDFFGLDENAPDVWVPIRSASRVGLDPTIMAGPGAAWLRIVARLRPGAPRSAADAEVRRLLATSTTHRGALGDPSSVAGVVGLNEARLEAGSPRYMTVSLTAALSVLLLLIATLNAAHLALVRAERRRSEWALRLAIGAPRSTIVWSVIVENAVIGGVGGAVGLLIAQAAERALRAYPVPAGQDLFDVRVIAITLGIATVLASAFGIVPATRVARFAPGEVLKDSEAGTSRVGARSRGLILTSQVALSFALLVTAGLVGRALLAVHSVGTGFDAEHLIFVTFDASGWPAYRADPVELQRQMADAVLAVDGVQRVSFSATAPLMSDAWTPVALGEGEAGSSVDSLVEYNAVDTAYFAVTGVPILSGRTFGASDGYRAEPAVVVSHSFAKRAFGTDAVLGRCVRVGGAALPCSRIVGVAGDIRPRRLQRASPPRLIYTPLVPARGLAGAMSVRARRSDGVVPRVQDALQSVRADMPTVRVQAASALVARQERPWRNASTLTMVIAGCAIALCAVGLYGAAAYSASRMRREIAIRLALGSRPTAVALLIARRSVLYAAAGFAVGAAVAAVGGRWLAVLLYAVPAWDPRAFFLAFAFLSLVVVLACLLPASAAARVPLSEALRRLE